MRYGGAIPLAGEGLRAARCEMWHTQPCAGTGAHSGARAGVQCKVLPFLEAEGAWGEEAIEQAGLVPAGGDSPLGLTLAPGLLPHTS